MYQTSFWGGFVSVIGAYYLLPLFLAFLIAYALLPIDPIQGARQKVPFESAQYGPHREAGFGGLVI